MLNVSFTSFILYRIDTLLYLLCYPQVPLVRTKVRSVSVCFTHPFLWIRICVFSASDLLNVVWSPPQTIDLIQFDKLPAGNVSIRTPVALLIIIIVCVVLRWFDLRLNHLRANEKNGASKACLSQRSTRNTSLFRRKIEWFVLLLLIVVSCNLSLHKICVEWV